MLLCYFARFLRKKHSKSLMICHTSICKKKKKEKKNKRKKEKKEFKKKQNHLLIPEILMEQPEPRARHLMKHFRIYYVQNTKNIVSKLGLICTKELRSIKNKILILKSLEISVRKKRYVQ